MPLNVLTSPSLSMTMLTLNSFGIGMGNWSTCSCLDSVAISCSDIVIDNVADFGSQTVFRLVVSPILDYGFKMHWSGGARQGQ